MSCEKEIKEAFRIFHSLTEREMLSLSQETLAEISLLVIGVNLEELRSAVQAIKKRNSHFTTSLTEALAKHENIFGKSKRP